ncbi:hypothetical protein KAR10_01830, partial [bacterium]|nr:hypothetical protein [bacterium]
MSAQRRKRLPTDFFDRLLSNQTDNQINDLLTSLVDEQISPALETVKEEPPRPAPAITGVGYRKGIQQGKIEESIVTRDEELQEEVPALDQDSSWEELIPRTRQMRAQKITSGVKAPEKTEPEKTEPVIDLRGQNQLEADTRILKENPLAEEEIISKVVGAPPPGVHGAPETPEITDISWRPEVPLPPQDEASPGADEASPGADEASVKVEDAGKPAPPQAAAP